MSNKRVDRPLDMNQPVWTSRHVARLFDVSVEYAQKYIVVAPGFPAPRRPGIGKEGDVEMSKSYYKDEVLAWYDRQPVITTKSA